MATFKVGQRARVIGEYAGEKPFSVIGHEGAVISVGVFETLYDGTVPYAVRLDLMPDRVFGFHQHQLEPIQPERNQTIAWSECVWRPEHLRETA